MQYSVLVTFFAIHRMMIKSGGFLDGTGGILLATRWRWRHFACYTAAFCYLHGGILHATRPAVVCLLSLSASAYYFFIKFFGGS